MNDTVTRFPIYNLYNVPEALRKLATDIEEAEEPVKHCIVVMQKENDGLDYRAFGKDFCKAHAIGLLEFSKTAIMGG